jgi:acetolactate synthase I/II/III large subunit
MALVTGGELVVRAVRKAGVEKLFALHGANIDTIFQGCLDNGVPIVDTRHEMNAGHAAEGYARVTQRLGVACVTAGGGMTNVVTSMANALLDRTPVLYLCGSGMLKQRQINTLQSDIDQVALATPVTKWAHAITCIDQIPRLVAQAIRIATQAPRGPVMLDLPWDVLLSTIDEDTPMQAGPTVLRSGQASDSDIRQIIEGVSSSKRPVILLGSEAIRSDTRRAVERLAAATGVPVFAEFEGLGLLRDLPDHLHGGLVQSLYGLKAQSPDLVLMAGIRFGLYTGHGTGQLIPYAARTIQIDPDAREIGRLQPVEFGVCADVGSTLQALATAAETVASPDRAPWQAVIRGHVKKRYTAISGQVKERPGVLHPLRASDIVVEHVTKDVTVVADGALTYLWLSEVIAQRRPAALLFHSHLSSMGCGFGVAIGAQAGVEPGKRVILVTGDGAVGYSLGEFDTAVRNKLPLIVVVMNNQSWGATLHFQQMIVGADRVTGTRLENGRYEGAAAALGAGSYFADDAATFRKALSAALAKNEPACINVLVDLDPTPPEELVVMGMDPFEPPSAKAFGGGITSK